MCPLRSSWKFGPLLLEVRGLSYRRREKRLGLLRFAPTERTVFPINSGDVTLNFSCVIVRSCSICSGGRAGDGWRWGGGCSWAFLCADGGVLAWEQGMVSAERTGAAVGADQACVRFEHPAMFQELSAMEPQEGEVTGSLSHA